MTTHICKHPINTSVTTHFETIFQSALNLGPSQRTLKYMSRTLKKKIKNHILHGWLYFSCLKILNIIINLENVSISSNVLLKILSIVRSFVMGLKNYCWDKRGFASCKLNQFLQTRFCQSFSHRRIIGNSFLLRPESWTFLNILNPQVLQDCTYTPPPKILSIHSCETYVIF